MPWQTGNPTGLPHTPIAPLQNDWRLIWHKGVVFHFPNHISLPPSQNSSLAEPFKEVQSSQCLELPPSQIPHPVVGGFNSLSNLYPEAQESPLF